MYGAPCMTGSGILPEQPQGRDAGYYQQMYQTPQVPQGGIFRSFCNRILDLMRAGNRDIHLFPRTDRKMHDLYHLYCAVQRCGGYQNMRPDLWWTLATQLNHVEVNRDVGSLLHQRYDRFILPFESLLLKEFPVDPVPQMQPEPAVNWQQVNRESAWGQRPYQGFIPQEP